MSARKKKLVVSERSKYFQTTRMKYSEFPSDLKKIREFAMFLIKDMPDKYKEKNLLEQQISEILKNAVKHGNKEDPAKTVKVWYKAVKSKKYVHFIVEDEGEGFQNLEEWNEFYTKRDYYIQKQDFENMIKYINYQGPASTEMDGGNALIAAIEYWNGGMIYNKKRNKVAVVKNFK